MGERGRAAQRFAFVVTGVALLAVVAWASARSEAAGEARFGQMGSPIGDGVRNNLALIVAGGSLAALVIYVLPVLLRRRDRARPRPLGELKQHRWLQWLATVAIVLTLAGVVRLTANRDEPGEPEAPPTPTAPVEQAAPGDSSGAQGWTAVALLTGGALVVGVAAAVMRVRRRRSPRQFDELSTLPTPGEPLDLEALEPVDAARVAYRGALGQLATMGLRRGGAETPQEHLRRIGPRLGHGQRALTALVNAYELARYSNHPVTVATKSEVIASYQVVASLAAAADASAMPGAPVRAEQADSTVSP